MSDVDQPRKGITASVIATIGVFALFLLILLAVRQTPTPLDQVVNVPEEEQWRLTGEGRKARLAEIRGREKSAVAAYEWIDRDAGVVRLPIEQAMRLTIEDINAARN